MTDKKLFLSMIVILMITLSFGSAKAAEPIIVGGSVSLTGPFADDGQVQSRALQMAVDEYNANGGLLGRKLKYVAGDAGGNQFEQVKAVGERLIAAGSDVIITGWESLDDSNIRVYGKYDVPYLTGHADHTVTDAIAAGLPKTGNCFKYVWSELNYSHKLMEEMFEVPRKMNWKAPNKDIAVIKVDIPYNMNPANLFVKLAKKAGYNVVLDETAQLGVTDWSPVIRKIERKKPAYIVFFNLVSSDAARFQKAFYERFARRGLESLLVYQYTPSLHEFQKLAGEEAVEGVIYMGASIRMGNPKVIEYTERWREKYNETPTGAYAWIVRDAFEIWVQAVKRAGCVECYDKVSQKIREATYSPGLWAHTYAFHPQKQEALVGEYLSNLDWLQIRNGKHLGVHPERVKDTEYQKQPWMKK